VTSTINSLDRFVRGSIDLSTIENVFGGLDNFGVQLVGKNTGQTYGFSALSDAYIHEEDFLNSDEEGAQSLQSLDEKSWKQDVIYYKKDGKLYYMTTVDQIDEFEIKLFKEGEELVSMDYGLTAVPEVFNLIDDLDQAFREMPFANNGEIPSQYIAEVLGPDYEDEFPEDSSGTDPPITDPPLLAARSALSAKSLNFFDPVEWRNLTTRCMEALFEELEKKVQISAGKIAEGGEVIVKQTVGYATGYLKGIWGGLKSDWEGIVELKNLLLHPIDTTRSVYEGFKALLGLEFEEWKALGQHMFDSMISSAQQGLPWEYKGDNAGDQAALIAYINGYGAGFVSEQALMIYLGAGVVSKIGQSIKAIVTASKAGQLAARLAANGLNAAKNLSRKIKISTKRWWSRYAKDENDLNRIVAAIEGAYRNEGTAGYDSTFLNAHRAVAEGLDQLDDQKANMKKLLEELGDDAEFKDLDKLDNFQRSHVAQYVRRLGQVTTTLKKAGALSEDALIGFTRLYKHLIKNAEPPDGGTVIRERVRDMSKLFDTKLAQFETNLDAQDIKGAKALAKSLEDYKVRSEANGFDGKFWFKDVEKVYTKAYRYDSFEPAGGWANFNGSFPARPQGWYASFDFFDNKFIATDRLLLPLETSAPKYRFEFDVPDIKDNVRMARGKQDTDIAYEPLTRDEPANFAGGGTTFKGKGTQVILENANTVKRVVDMDTGNQVWPTP